MADAFFSKINFVLGLDCLGFNLVSRLRDDAVLRYLYTGERTGKRGCPKKFDRKVDICNPDGKVFTTTSFTDGKDSIRLSSGIVWCNSLKRKVVLAIVEYLDSDKKTQVRKLYFSTDLTMSGLDVYNARMLELFISRFGKLPNSKINDTVLKELILYGVRDAV